MAGAQVCSEASAAEGRAVAFTDNIYPVSRPHARRLSHHSVSHLGLVDWRGSDSLFGLQRLATTCLGSLSAHSDWLRRVSVVFLLIPTEYSVWMRTGLDIRMISPEDQRCSYALVYSDAHGPCRGLKVVMYLQ